MYISQVICKRSIGPCVFFALISVPVNTAVNCSLFCFVLFTPYSCFNGVDYKPNQQDECCKCTQDDMEW